MADDSPAKKNPMESPEYIQFLADCRWNVKLMFIATLFLGVFDSVGRMGVFDTYLFVRGGNSHSDVGIAESINGVITMVTCVPVGYLVDRYDRARILFWTGILGYFSCGFMLSGIMTDQLYVIYASLFFVGLYSAFQASAGQALFADSIPMGDRSRVLAKREMVYQGAFTLGPLFGVMLFTIFGNEWTLDVLHLVLLVANLGLLIPNTFLLRWRNVVNPLRKRRTLAAEEAMHGVAEMTATDADVQRNRAGWGKYVPHITVFCNIVIATGAGMTEKFFPIYFKEEYKFTPITVQYLYCGYGPFLAFCTHYQQIFAKKIGRIQANFILQIIGVICLFLIAYVPDLTCTVICFLIRGAAATSAAPIDRSVIMDYVSSEERGKWNAIAALTSMTWSGSAVLGGMLIADHGYSYTFYFTAYFYLASIIIRLPLLWIVPREEPNDTLDANKKAANLDAAGNNYIQPPVGIASPAVI